MIPTPEPIPAKKSFQGLRKIYHVLAASLIPVIYLYLPFSLNRVKTREGLLISLGCFFAASLSVDLLRLWHKEFNSRFMLFFSALIRPTEKHSLNGSTFLCFSFFAVIYFFTWKVAVTSMLFLSLGDAAAELSGKNFGKSRIFQRSAEGTAAFFIVAFFTALALWEDWRIALAGAGAGALVELFSFDWDDNLTVPIGSALALWSACAFFQAA
jgi:glycerol-3-phosphate acyltransferase PlsY